MGLDTVELVMDVEDAFDIRLPDDECCRMRTVGQLADCVLDHLAAKPNDRCMTAYAFRKVRRVIVGAFGRPPAEVRPNTAVAQIDPSPGRRSLYARLREELDWSKELFINNMTALLLFTPVIAAIAWLVAMMQPVAVQVAVVSIVSFLWIALAWSQRPRPFVVHTLGDLTHSLLRGNYIRVTEAADRDAEERVRIQVRAIVAETFGVNVARVNDSLRFVEDLNA